LVGGLVVPALVGLEVRTEVTVAISLVVAVAIAIEGLFRYGDRWRHYRRTAESLKAQGWQFYELAGADAAVATHAAGFTTFAAAVEALLAGDVDEFIAKISTERQAPKE